MLFRSGIDSRFGTAFAKSQIAAGNRLPDSGAVFLSLADRDKDTGLPAAVRFVELGFSLCATEGTARFLEDNGVPVETVVAKIGDPGGDRLTAADLIASGKIQLVINTPRGHGPRADGAYIRRAANVHQVACLTTIAAARAAAAGIADWAAHPLQVRSLQEYHEEGQQRLPL